MSHYYRAAKLVSRECNALQDIPSRTDRAINLNTGDRYSIFGLESSDREIDGLYFSESEVDPHQRNISIQFAKLWCLRFKLPEYIKLYFGGKPFARHSNILGAAVIEFTSPPRPRQHEYEDAYSPIRCGRGRDVLRRGKR